MSDFFNKFVLLFVFAIIFSNNIFSNSRTINEEDDNYKSCIPDSSVDMVMFEDLFKISAYTAVISGLVGLSIVAMIPEPDFSTALSFSIRGIAMGFLIGLLGGSYFVLYPAFIPYSEEAGIENDMYNFTDKKLALSLNMHYRF